MLVGAEEGSWGVGEVGFERLGERGWGSIRVRRFAEGR